MKTTTTPQPRTAVPKFVYELVTDHILDHADLREELAVEAAAHGDLDQTRDLRAGSREAAKLAAEGIVEMAREGHERPAAIMRDAWAAEEEGAIALTPEEMVTWAETGRWPARLKEQLSR